MIVYKVTAPSGNCYIGITCRSLRQRKNEHLSCARRGHPTRFYNAIRKYQKRLKWEILEKNVDNYKMLQTLERMYIEDFKPQYNLTIGGEGTNGYKHSKAARVKFSKRNKGKPSNARGSKRTQEQLRKQQTNSPLSKPVKCLTTNKVYFSAAEASRILNVHRGNIGEVCNGKRKRAGGMKFSWIKEYL